MKEKRSRSTRLGKQDLHRKRIKINDLGSVIQSAESTKEEEEEQSLQLPLDLNVDACCANDECTENPTNVFLTGKLDKEHHICCVKSKSKDVSESGSCTGPMEEKDPLRIWRESKQNGSLSSSHGGIQDIQRERKRKEDVLKKKMELAKREEVDRFAKIAAPTGLLSELNPGIINHVRNRKQVLKIIEALLVRSERQEHGSVGNGMKQATNITSASAEFSKRDLETKKCPVKMDDDSCGEVGDGDTCTVGKTSTESCILQSTYITQDDTSPLKSSSPTKEPSNFNCVSSLSVKAATVASQWLELLHQDIKGRLSALRCSRRRVGAVITTELPLLISKEFSTNHENNAHVEKLSAGCSNSETVDIHRARWAAIFNQLDGVLLQQEKLLESSLSQVREKQLLCDQGIRHLNCDKPYRTLADGSRVWMGGELAINAAAASLYSTCNFLFSES